MTVKLYDEDSYLSEFSAVVLSCEKTDEKYRILLDKTAFFPEEGGQCSDRGTLGGANVYHVELSGDEIYHYCDYPLKAGEEAVGKIDFSLRFRNMQNHSGEHIISGLAHKLFGYENVGFHLGEDRVTMDLNGPLSEEEADRLELLANRVVYKNMPVYARYPKKEELENMEYRAKSGIDGNIRIVTVGDIDSCACCAPHVKNTGEIGIIKILDVMKYKGGVRLTIACGMDALSDYSKKHKQNVKISTLLSAKQEETFEAVNKLSETIGNLNIKLSEKDKIIAEHTVNSISFTDSNLCIFTDNNDMGFLRLVANDLKEKTSSFAAVLSGNDTDGYRYVIISAKKDISDFLNEANKALLGKGGGRGNMASGNFGATREEIMKFFS